MLFLCYEFFKQLVQLFILYFFYNYLIIRILVSLNLNWLSLNKSKRIS